MKIFAAQETISVSMLTLATGDIGEIIIRGLKAKVHEQALDFIGCSDAATVEKLNEAMDVETHYMERGKCWKVTVSIAIPERKELFKR